MGLVVFWGLVVFVGLIRFGGLVVFVGLVVFMGLIVFSTFPVLFLFPGNPPFNNILGLNMSGEVDYFDKYFRAFDIYLN